MNDLGKRGCNNHTSPRFFPVQSLQGPGTYGGDPDDEHMVKPRNGFSY